MSLPVKSHLNLKNQLPFLNDDGATDCDSCSQLSLTQRSNSIFSTFSEDMSSSGTSIASDGVDTPPAIDFTSCFCFTEENFEPIVAETKKKRTRCSTPPMAQMPIATVPSYETPRKGDDWGLSQGASSSSIKRCRRLQQMQTERDW